MTTTQLKSIIKTATSGNYAMICRLELRGNKLVLVNKLTGTLHMFPDSSFEVVLDGKMIREYKEMMK